MNNLFSSRAVFTRLNAVFFSGKISEMQSKGCEKYMTAYFFLKMKKMRIPLNYLSYTLSTVYHETAFTMEPIEEYKKGAGHEYGIPDPVTGQTYYGRGDVQVTWKYNYERLSKIMFNIETMEQGVDLVNNPDLLLTPIYSAQATILGMSTGLFTGKSYSDYLDQEEPDYVNARKIINGTDRAHTLAGYAHDFERALRLGFGAPLDRDTIQLYSNGSDVRELQLNLNLEPDGVFGNNTKQRVIQFQERYGLTADGVVGEKTWKKIESVFYWERQ
ncbi:conserved hypothetical protein [Vibrio owensii]|uniref:Peptidoglycan binding-like domain-containing protein n=1 Tax=Vibrio owensii TaxID=696485 RepID=A0AAU9PYU7_9VIBR|nr:conserved hypothetical protein [Vibrio owensii]